MKKKNRKLETAIDELSKQAVDAARKLRKLTYLKSSWKPRKRNWS